MKQVKHPGVPGTPAQQNERGIKYKKYMETNKKKTRGSEECDARKPAARQTTYVLMKRNI